MVSGLLYREFAWGKRERSARAEFGFPPHSPRGQLGLRGVGQSVGLSRRRVPRPSGPSFRVPRYLGATPALTRREERRKPAQVESEPGTSEDCEFQSRNVLSKVRT